MKRFKGILFIITVILVTIIVLPFIKDGKKDSVEVIDLTNIIETPVSYASTSYEIKALPVDSAMSYVVTADVLRVREEPNTGSTILGRLTYGTEINPSALLENGWYRISYNNKEAYVSGEFIKVCDPNKVEAVSKSEYLVIVNSKYNTLNIYQNGDLLESYDCATGKSSSPSPEGNFEIVNKVVDPSWKGQVAGGDPKNPLGRRWMGLNVPGTSGSTYGIHGNSNESSIGKNVSGGCIRMHNADVEYVFDYLPVGTQVIISSLAETDKYIAESYGFSIN